jgi:hypothetical protein
MRRYSLLTDKHASFHDKQATHSVNLDHKPAWEVGFPRGNEPNQKVRSGHRCDRDRFEKIINFTNVRLISPWGN